MTNKTLKHSGDSNEFEWSVHGDREKWGWHLSLPHIDNGLNTIVSCTNVYPSRVIAEQATRLCSRLFCEGLNFPRNVSEARFQALLIKMARLLGWNHYHTHDSRRSPSGYPDLHFWRTPNEMIWAELKKNNTYPSSNQKRILEEFQTITRNVSTMGAFLWKPRDWYQIFMILGGAEDYLAAVKERQK